MSVLLEDAGKLSSEQKLVGTVESVAMEDRLFRVLPFVACTSLRGLIHEREGVAPDASFIEMGGDVTESATTFDEVTTKLRQITDDVDILGAVRRYGNNLNAQVATQIAYKARACARKFANAVINGGYATIALNASNVTGVTLASTGPRHGITTGVGAVGVGRIKQVVSGGTKKLAFWAPGDTGYGDLSDDLVSPADQQNVTLRSKTKNLWIRVNVETASLAVGNVEDTNVTSTTSTKSFDGINRLCDPSQIITPTNTDGDILTLEILHELIDKCIAGSGQKFLIMSKRALRAYAAILLTSGNAQPPQIALPFYGATAGTFPSYMNVPILDSDAISNAEAVGANNDAETIYCASIGIPTGVPEEAPQQGPGLFGMYGSNGLSATAEGRTLLGMWIEELGYLESKDRYRARVGWDCSLVHYATRGIAMRTGITPSGL